MFSKNNKKTVNPKAAPYGFKADGTPYQRRPSLKRRKRGVARRAMQSNAAVKIEKPVPEALINDASQIISVSGIATDKVVLVKRQLDDNKLETVAVCLTNNDLMTYLEKHQKDQTQYVIQIMPVSSL